MVQPAPMKSLTFFFLQVSAALSQSCSSGAGAQAQVFVDDVMGADSNLMMLQVRSTEKRSTAGDVEFFEVVGVGCCSGNRDADGGKIWAGPTSDLVACKLKCLEFEDCGAVEYGWTFNEQWCFVWSNKQMCASLESGQDKCGQGGSDGVHAYKMRNIVVDYLKVPESRRPPDSAALKELALKAATDIFDSAGVGCCSGDRDAAHGKLWAGPAPDLITCKAKCLEYDSCGAVEYGWTNNVQWCFIWSDHQKCSSLESGEGRCGPGGSDGVQVYKIIKGTKHDVFKIRSTYYFSLSQSSQPSNVTEVAPTHLLSKPADDFATVGDGCCVGIRNENNGKLWSGTTDSLDACKQKCREFGNCGVIEYGWKWEAQSCFIWDKTQQCHWLEAGKGKCEGFQAYRLQQSMSMQEFVKPVSKALKEKAVSSEALRKAKAHAEKAEEHTERQKPSGAAAAKAVATAKAHSMQDKKHAGVHKGTRQQSALKDGSAKNRTDGKAKDNKSADFTMVGAGCCSGSRDSKSGKLWAGPQSDLAACQAKCREFADCSAVEYGWDSPTSDHKFCFIWSSPQNCSSLDRKCGSGNGEGVHAYKFKASRPIELKDAELVSRDFNKLGAGCCSGARMEKTGKLWAGPQRDLEACMAKCREHDNCGFVEYGWNGAATDHQFCFIWSDQQKCSSLDQGADKCGTGGSDGVHAYKYIKNSSTEVLKAHATEPATAKKVPRRTEIAQLHDNGNWARKMGWSDLGAGCCKGARKTKDTMLLVELDLANLDKCKEICADIANCGAVEWVADEDSTACYLWTDKTDCSGLVVGKGCEIHDAFHSVRSYQITRG